MTKIEWVKNADGTQGRSWNPVRGCTRITKGCERCYAERIASRFHQGPIAIRDSDVVRRFNGPFAGFSDARGWTGRVELIEEKLSEPLRWRKPQVVFVNSMSDLWHKALAIRDIARVYSVMFRAPQHTYIVLTKRSARRKEVLCGEAPEPFWDFVSEFALKRCRMGDARIVEGSSPHDQASADEMIPHLLATPAWKRIVSVEPMLGDVNLHRYLVAKSVRDGYAEVLRRYPPDPSIPIPEHLRLRTSLDGVICGGESGPGARPMHPDWARSLRDQCVAAGVPFFFKQWGEWAPSELGRNSVLAPGAVKDESLGLARVHWMYPDGTHIAVGKGFKLPKPDVLTMRVGKNAAGRLLDGKEHNEVAW